MNPFLSCLNTLQLAPHANGPAGCLHLLLTFGAANYSGTVTTNPFTEVKRLLLASAGRSAMYQECEGLLTSAEMRWR